MDFPASSPYVLACGGTELIAANNAISQETVWNFQGGATGGGISTFFPKPSYQSTVTLSPSHRCLPDISGDASPQSGYIICQNGQNYAVGGTSAVAPLWAALLAKVNQERAAQSKGSIGFVHPLLYSNESALRDITSGTNGVYKAAVGWDACTGLGSPEGAKISTLLLNA